MYDGERRRDWNDEERRGDVSVYVLCQDMLRKIVKRKKKLNHPHTFEPFPVRQSLASPTTTRKANTLPNSPSSPSKSSTYALKYSPIKVSHSKRSLALLLNKEVTYPCSLTETKKQKEVTKKKKRKSLFNERDYERKKFFVFQVGGFCEVD